MKKLSFAIVTFSLIVFFGCSKLKNENPAAVPAGVDPHGEGWASPASANFHGTALAAQPNDTAGCKQCHGPAYNGGTAQSCNACHAKNHSGGVASKSSPAFHGIVIAARNGDTQKCTKCHGADYNGGIAHSSCNGCHTTNHPGGVASPSAANFHGKIIAANNWSLGSCKKCHGGNYAGTPLGISCLSCHNKPNGPENCSTCHGSSTSIAPPQDLAGNTSPTARAVGAHQTHLAAAGTGAGMKCSNCHSVPSSLEAPGHLDATQYAEVKFDTTGNLAFTKSNVAGTANYTPALPTIVPNPSYSSASVKCSNTYCHGNFKNGNASNAPTWNDTSAAACGTCHGDKTKATLLDRALPGGTHIQFNGCSNCHTGAIDADGKLLEPAKHVNGKLSVFGTEQNF